MSYRLSHGGRLIDRNKSPFFTFNGRQMRGFRGDTLASALIAPSSPRGPRSRTRW